MILPARDFGRFGQQPSPSGWPLPRTHSALGVKRSKRATRNAANGKEVICDEHTVFATTNQTNKTNQTNAKPIQQPLRAKAGTRLAKNILASQWIGIFAIRDTLRQVRRHRSSRHRLSGYRRKPRLGICLLVRERSADPNLLCFARRVAGAHPLP